MYSSSRTIIRSWPLPWLAQDAIPIRSEKLGRRPSLHVVVVVATLRCYCCRRLDHDYDYRGILLILLVAPHKLYDQGTVYLVRVFQHGIDR